MNVKLLRVETNEFVSAEIIKARNLNLPSIHEGWRFNFSKNAKDKGALTCVIVINETPDVFEGCLIYKMKEELEPYMAYIEIAPHNRGAEKIYDRVAGCLIAFACRLSFLLGQGDFKGWLAFDVHEESEEDQIKLMALYSKKYHALRVQETTMMVISPNEGEKLINEYLEN